jgi:hypothetical protein
VAIVRIEKRYYSLSLIPTHTLRNMVNPLDLGDPTLGASTFIARTNQEEQCPRPSSVKNRERSSSEGRPNIDVSRTLLKATSIPQL